MHGHGVQDAGGRVLDSPLSVALAVTIFALDFLLMGLRWFSLEYFFAYGRAPLRNQICRAMQSSGPCAVHCRAAACVKRLTCLTGCAQGQGATSCCTRCRVTAATYCMCACTLVARRCEASIMSTAAHFCTLSDPDTGTARRGAGGGIFPVYRLMLLPAALTVMAANVLARLDMRPSAAVQLGLWLLVVACLVAGMHVRPLVTDQLHVRMRCGRRMFLALAKPSLAGIPFMHRTC